MSDKRTTLRAAQILEDAAALIEKGGWSRVWLARDARGEPVEPKSSSAVRWCAAGAIVCVAGRAASTSWDIARAGRASTSWDIARGALLDEVGAISIGFWNDAQPNRRPVVAAMRRAARKLRESVNA